MNTGWVCTHCRRGDHNNCKGHGCLCPAFERASRPAVESFEEQADYDALAVREALEMMVHQFAYWDDRAGGYWTGGLSALEVAFGALGWEDTHPYPEARCDEPGCMKQISTGWPTRLGGTGPNGGYRRTCGDHYREYNPR